MKFEFPVNSIPNVLTIVGTPQYETDPQDHPVYCIDEKSAKAFLSWISNLEYLEPMATYTIDATYSAGFNKLFPDKPYVFKGKYKKDSTFFPPRTARYAFFGHIGYSNGNDLRYWEVAENKILEDGSFTITVNPPPGTGHKRLFFQDYWHKNEYEDFFMGWGTPEPPVPTTKSLEPKDVSQLTDFYSHVQSTNPVVNPDTKAWTELPTSSSVDIKFTFDIKPQTLTFTVYDSTDNPTILQPSISGLTYTYTIPIDAVTYSVVSDFTPPPPPTKTLKCESTEEHKAEFLAHLQSSTPKVDPVTCDIIISSESDTNLSLTFDERPLNFELSATNKVFGGGTKLDPTIVNGGKTYNYVIPYQYNRYWVNPLFPSPEPPPTPTTRTIKYTGSLDALQDLINHTSSIKPMPNIKTGDIEEQSQDAFPLVITFNESPVAFHLSISRGAATEELVPKIHELTYTYNIPVGDLTYYFIAEWKPLPPPVTTSTNLFTIYAPTDEQIGAFDSYRRVNTADDISYPQYENLLSFRRFFCPIETDAELKPFRVKDIDLGSKAKVVSRLIQTIDCGTIKLKDSKLITSYSPFSTYRIFLPFIGFQNLSDDDVIGDSMNLSYEIDFTSGQCLAIIKCYSNEQLIATNEYSGLISQDYPLGNSSFVRSGSYAVVAARIMGSLKPYIIKTQRTIPNTPDYPLFKTIKEVDVSQLTGFNVIDRIIPPADKPFEGTAEMFNNLMEILHKGINFS